MEINFFNIVWSAVSYYLVYKIGYYIIETGLKRFEIENVPELKRKIYVIVTLVISLIADFTINPIIISLFLVIINKILLLLVESIVFSLFSFLISFILFKYYFLLSGKKLWQLASYIAIINLIFILIINGLLLL